MPRRPNNIDPRYAQRIDPRTGLTEIEAVMRQDEPKSPPPRVPKPQINFPLPWKHKGNQTQTNSVTAMRELYEDTQKGQRSKITANTAVEFDRGYEGPTVDPRDRTRGLVVDSNVGSLEHGIAEQRHYEKLYTYANERVAPSSSFHREDSGQPLRRFNKASAPLLGQVEPSYVPPQGMGRAEILTTIPPPHTSAEARNMMPRAFSGSFGANNGNVVVPQPVPTSLFGVGDSYKAANYNHERREEQRRAALAAVNQLQDSQLPQGYNPITGVRSAGFSGPSDRRAVLTSATAGRNTREGSAAGTGGRGERAESTDIFGNPTAESKFTPEHLNFMKERRDAMDRAAREDEARREYDHYGRVMKRTVLVDEARRQRERAEHEMAHSAHSDFSETTTTGPTHFRNAQRQPTSTTNVRGRAVFADPNANAHGDIDEAPLDIFGNPTRRKAANVTRNRGAQEDAPRGYMASRPAALAAESIENNRASGNLRVVGAEHPLVPRVMQDRNRAIAEAQRGHSSTYGGANSAPPYAVDATYYRTQYQTSSDQRQATASGVMPDFLVKPSAASYAAPNVFLSANGTAQKDYNGGDGRLHGQGQFRGGRDEIAEGEKRAFAALDRARTGGQEEDAHDHQLEKAAEAFFRTSLGRKLVAAAKGWGVANLRTILKEMDKDADGVLSRSEFKQSMIKFGCELSADELSTLMRLAPVTSGTYVSAQAAEGKFSMNLDSFFEKSTGDRSSHSTANRASTAAHNEYPRFARQPAAALKTIPDPLPAMVVIEPLLHFLRRGERAPSSVVSCLRQCYRTVAKKVGGLVSGEAQARASSHAHGRNTAARVRATSSAPKPSSNVTYGQKEQEEESVRSRLLGLRFDQIKSATNFTTHSSYETCVQGSLRKVSLAFSNAWGPKVLADTIVTEDMFVEFWTDVRMSSYNNSDFIKMLQAMYASAGRG